MTLELFQRGRVLVYMVTAVELGTWRVLIGILKIYLNCRKQEGLFLTHLDTILVLVKHLDIEPLK